MKRTMSVTIFEAEEYTPDWPDFNTADEFVAFFTGRLAEIPEEHRRAAQINLYARTDCCGSPYLAVEIYYTRPETDEEVRKGEAEAAKRERIVQEKELEELARLKQKYPGA